uniref:Putative Ty1-copia-like retrotransposon n=1 Tax=Cercis chinensis TaxID=161750 RepID=U6EFK2_9FABA|nr:putative Ty1-copia-like retrotransposon [Cercis chinensis]
MEDHINIEVTPLMETQNLGSEHSANTMATQTTGINSNLPTFGQTLTIKLDRNNFLIWRNQLLNIVVANGYEDILEGTRSCPYQWIAVTDTASTTHGSVILNPEYVLWQRQNRLVMSWIYSSLTEQMMTQIMAYNSACEIWTALRESYASASRARIMELRLQLQTTRKGGLSVMDYMLRIQHICDHLRAIGESVSIDDQVMAVLAGLGSEYNPIVASITSRLDSISVQALQSYLETYEKRLEIQNSVEQHIPLQANAAMYNSNRGKRKPYQQNFHHSQTPVTATHNFNHRNSSQGGFRGGHSNKGRANPGSRPQCQICCKIGHVATECWHRFDNQFQPKASHSNQFSSSAQDPQALMAAPGLLGETPWFLDTGATHHVTSDLANLSLHNPFSGDDKVIVGNGKGLYVLHTGHSSIPTSQGALLLKNVLHVPKIAANLVSVQKLCHDNNAYVEFYPSYFAVKDQKTQAILLKGGLDKGLYSVPSAYSSHAPQARVFQIFSTSSSTSIDSMRLWHNRLGHPSLAIVNKVLNHYNLPVFSLQNKLLCDSCQLAKSHKLPFVRNYSKAMKPFDLVHADLWGSPSCLSVNGACYFLLLIDDYSRFSWLYLLQSKDETLTLFRQFQAMVERQFSTKNYYTCILKFERYSTGFM